MHNLMTILYLLFAGAAAVCFYTASAHQRFWRHGSVPVRALRLGGCGLLALSLACAIVALGPWAGVFAAMTTLMLAAIVLPCVDGWPHTRAQRRQVRNVG